MDANQLLIIDVKGSAELVLADGTIQVLEVGDVITVGDTVITAENSSIVIELKGVSLSIPADQKVTITPDLLAKEARDSSETSLFEQSIDDAIASLNEPNQENQSLSGNADVSEFLSALESGGDILDNLEATAAGGVNGAGSGGGSSFVELARIAEAVEPGSLSFNNNFETASNDIFSVRDTTDGVVPEVALVSFLNINELGLTNNSQPVISGTSENLAGQTVTINVTDVLGNVQTVVVVIAADGMFTSEPLGPLPDGPISVDVIAIGPDGEPVIDNVTANIDTTSPIITIDTLANLSSSVATITGSVSGIEEGSDVTITVTGSDGQLQNFVTQVDEQGNWSVTTAALAEGAFVVLVSAIDEAGNQGIANASSLVDVTAPIITIDPLGSSNDTTPTISGSVSGVAAGTEVTITVTDSNTVVQTLIVIIADDGSWSVIPDTVLAEGEYTVTASVTDSAGNTAQDTNVGEIDITVPLVDIMPLVDSQDTTPTINGTVQGVATGSLITVIVTDANGQQQTLLTSSNADGSWSIDIIDELAEGQYTVIARVTDAAGNQGEDSESGQVDLTALDISINTLADSSDVTPLISGESSGVPAGTVVTLLITDANGIAQTLTAIIAADGSWSVETTDDIAEGEYTVVATVSDAAGNLATDTATGIIDLTSLSVTLDALADSSDVTPLISGQSSGVPTGTTVTLVITDGNGTEQTLTATIAVDGSWSVEATDDIAEGEYTVVATVSDGSGNSATDTATGIIDLTSLRVTLDALADSNDVTPLLSGQSNGMPAGTTVNLVITDVNGAEQTLTAMIAADGSWSVEASDDIGEGEYTVVATVIDATGNSATDTATGVIDITAPIVSIDQLNDSADVRPLISGQSSGVPTGTTVTLVITDANGTEQTLTAMIAADGSWSVAATDDIAEGEYTVVATVSDAAGNQGSESQTGVIDITAPNITIDAPTLTNDNTPTVTGSSDLINSDLVVTFTDSNNLSHSVTVQTDNNGDWSADASQTLAEGEYSVSASVTDAAGNTRSVDDTGTIDTVAPELAFTPTFILGQLVSLTGTSDLPAGSNVTITQNLVGGGILTYSAITDANGDWSLIGLSVPLVNLVSITASATDEAGNTRTISSTDFDSTPPTLTISVDALTNDNTPLISGSSDAGEGAIVAIVIIDSVGTSYSISATVDSDGNWAVSPDNALPDGSFSVTASVTDAGGNTSSVSSIGSIDTLAPTLTLASLGTIYNSTPTISGTSNETAGSTVTITVSDDSNSYTFSATVLADGSWSATVPNALIDGSLDIVASISDAAGNSTSVSDTAILNTNAANITINEIGETNDTTPLLSGTSDAIDGSVISLVITDSNNTQQTLTTTVTGGIWSIDVNNALAEGEFTVLATVSEGGLESNVSRSGIIDTLPPAIDITTTFTLTADNTQLISGSSEMANSTITLTLTNGVDEYTFTTLSDALGNWSLNTTSLNDGTYTISATVSDVAGNQGIDTATGLEVDTVAISFEVTDFNPGILGLVLPSAEGTAPAGTEVFIIGGNLLGVGLLDIELSVLNTYPSSIANGSGEWAKTLSLLDLDLLSGEDYYFLTVDEAGNYLVKNTENEFVETGNIFSSSEDAASDTPELAFASEDSAELLVSNNSIDLNAIVASDPVVTESETQHLAVEDVLSESGDENIFVLDRQNESDSLAFKGAMQTTAEPAHDIQSQSEEIIKQLIEGSNNQLDI
ncbi:retention module-containing protein [Pseudoalteromonas mariniglutinosa]|uniref:retention module-containing protein n=1 Tax=Pseudoalteromonas mariniglutinosa TaxID=206042 RepID=UPI003850870E